MDDDNQRELEEMPPPVQDLVNDKDDDEDDNDDDGVAFEDYDLIGVPGQINPKPVPANSSDEEQEQQNDQQLDDQEEEQIEDDQQELEENDEARDGEDLNTIEVMSSEVEAESEVDGESESDEEKPKEPIDDSSDDDDEEVGGIDSTSSEENNLHFSTSDESEDGLERSFEELLAEPQKKYAELVKLSEIAFKLNDLNKIELSLQILQNEASVPAHIWVKYLKARQVVTQTPEEFKEFEEKCATALGSHYNLSLAEFIVGYLEDHENQNHVLWAKLVADYNVERPDYGIRLSAKFLKEANETQVAEFHELMLKHCCTWKISDEERESINAAVAEFKHHLDEMKMQSTEWDWEKLPIVHVNRALALDLNEDIQNAIIRYMFERIVAKFPIVDIVWLAYIRFIEGDADDDENNAELAAAKRASRLGKGFLLTTNIDLTRRAVRCRPSKRLNHKLLVLMERAHYELAAVDVEIHRILKQIQLEIVMSVELYLDYLAYHVRNTDFNNEEQAETLRGTFLRVWEELSISYGDLADSKYEILQLWAQVEYALMRCPSQGMAIWRKIFSYPGSNQQGLLWAAFAQMEHEYNGGYETCTILNEALSQPVLTDGVVVLDLYRRLERCFGTYESIAACQAIKLPRDFMNTRDYMAQRQYRSQPQHRGSRQYHPKQQQQAPRQNRPQPQKQAPSQRFQQPQQQAQAAPQPPLNRQERRRQAHAKITGKKREQALEEPTLAQPVTQESPTKAVTEVRESHLKYSAHLETNKVFVRNLHPACTKEELQELFTPFGQVKDVRVVYKQLQKRSIAYIEYEKPEEAKQAVAERNGHELRGLPLFVAISNPPPKTKPPGSTTAADGGKTTNVAGQKRVLTSLIPTSVVRQETAAVAAKKRRIELAQEEDGPQQSTSSNGKAAPETEETAPPKSNEDFRKLFLKEE